MDNNHEPNERLKLVSRGDLSHEHIAELLKDVETITNKRLAEVRFAIFDGICMRLRSEESPERVRHLQDVRDTLRNTKEATLECENGTTVRIPAPKRT